MVRNKTITLNSQKEQEEEGMYPQKKEEKLQPAKR
jgi:hypothetical protein